MGKPMMSQLQDERGEPRTSDLVGRAALAGRYHDKKLHDGVVDPGTPGLDDEDILLSHAGHDPDACLALGRWLVCLWIWDTRLNQGLRREAREVRNAGEAAKQSRGGGGRKLTLENWVSSALAGVMPRFSHIWPVRAGHELPAKISVLRILANP